MKKQKSDLVLVDRDFELFEYLYRNKVALFRQIKDELFADVKKVTTYKRLGQLQKARFLRVVAIPNTRWRNNAYGLTEKSFCLVVDMKSQNRLRKQYKSDSVQHDLDLVDIHNVIGRCEFVTDLITENELQSGASFISKYPVGHLKELRTDGVIVIKYNEQLYYIGIEYEASFKHRHRTINKLMRYYTNPDVSNVIFVCKTDKLLKDFLHLESLHCSSHTPKVFYTTLEKLLTSSSNVTFHNIKGETLDIGRIHFAPVEKV